ncbi:MAG: protein adenylyltransferase SelO family protein, partial [Synechococcaceae cyanobacterium]|nr:protein adenylyltransferase SelO family protein [Synechococcaceae cyanobacterium]
AHPQALHELRLIVAHLIERNYRPEIDPRLEFTQQLLALAALFRSRLIALVAHWIRVGYCQGNFNSDNCAAAGFTLDYGPFGFCERFDPHFQPWIGGGEHFSFFNQPVAAEVNYQMFCSSIRPLLADDSQALAGLEQIQEGFAAAMNQALAAMWASKLGLIHYNAALVTELLQLLVSSNADMTIFFRRLSDLPADLSALKDSFYTPSSEQLDAQWTRWLQSWRALLSNRADLPAISAAMKRVNPTITWREWLIAPAYQQAAQGDFSLIQELQALFSHPYEDQPPHLDARYNRLKPLETFHAGGISHYSCSS